ncbi:MAG: transposase [Candidatus Saccharimonadales bacterium]
MPSKNVVKIFEPNSYYHIYNRGVAKQPIFQDSKDKDYFLSLLNRHLDPDNQQFKADGTFYRKFHNDIEILCYCLMGNHLHLLIYQAREPRAISDLMRSIFTAYTMYFNHKYKRVGPLFQGVYKASKITNDNYLLHISRYIHLNPRTYKTYRYSSVAQFLGEASPVWLKPQKILDLFEGESYANFLKDYEDYRQAFEIIKHELANSI